MAMVTPFQHERQLDPHRSKHIQSKRSQGHDGFGGIQRTLISVNSPMRPASTERTRISTNQETAQCFEPGGISLGERERVGDARHSLPEDGTMEYRSEAWFEFAHAVRVQDVEINAELLRKRTFTGKGSKTAGAAVKLQPAILA